MATTKLLLQQPYKKGGGKILNPLETRLYLFLIIDRTRIVKIKTEHVIYPKEWDFRNQQKKEIAGNLPGNPEKNEKIQKFNKELRKLKEDTETEYRNLVKQFPDLPFSQIADILKKFWQNKRKSFCEY